MTQKINDFAIGSFVVGAFILLLFFLVFFSGGNYFTDKETVVMYFDGSVQGLKIGAPVKLKGAELGQVVGIEVTFLSDDLSIVNTVTANIILKHIRQNGEQLNEDIFDAVIKKGLRAQLNYQSLLTGQLYVDLDFYPDSILHLHKLQTEYREFPTIKTDFESLFNEFERVDILSISNSLTSVLNSLNGLFKSGQINMAINNFDDAAQAVKKTANHIDNARLIFEEEMTELNKQLDISLTSLNKLLDQGNKQIPTLSNEFILTSTSLRKTLDGINQAIKNTEGTLSEDSLLIDQLMRSAEEVSRAAQAFRQLSNTLEQQPEALLRGKK